MKTHKIGIIMNGVTGRMGTNQHLMRSIVEIIKQGGVAISDEEVIMPDPILVGRNPVKLEKLVAMSGIEKWTTDLDSALSDPHYKIYFDAQTTDRRYAAVKEAIKAKKHIYCEKPTAQTTQEALDLYNAAKKAGLKHGVVQDKLWLPGILKLKVLIDTGFFGEIHMVQGDFGYWVFEGEHIASQRPSWNYRKEDGGGIILDLFPHWRYLLDNLFGKVKAVSCFGAIHVKKRWQENGEPYLCTADDAAYATLELENDITVQFNSSWATRVRRDDLLTLQVDGSHGSAVAGLRNCVSQPYTHTPRPVWNPDIDSPINYYDQWTSVPAFTEYENAFKIQWELFLRYVVKDESFQWDLLEGAKGIQLAELAHESWQSRRWVDVPDLEE
ncbi:Gfo/Idh/MocA family oxidoreductase [candidate division KSB1 bacterium]|nr:Gfo/Idh/MocA family oxidoreductase [candidate division KSB1 bacterium]NIV70800.1 Gfo/Idh/MocA family oxidoreductase [Phycisphaerae bacterium]NIR72918.1 Gfo/Idh/MocA family oxidoreductase [candidate division KSB1 bacterium]NIT73716.1 Gfo/Idh/MocA family oxidoreductase [candidate division KSB1 bacterium]NIU27588.1 Gfo/Idh/MocA family oxidoreductase [candidate division KSB1 bacterium]